MDELLENLHRPQWLRGPAGSGKTVMMTLLVERICATDTDGSICFISFTHALKDLVVTGFHGEVARRVDVMTYHRFLGQKRHYKYVFVDEVQDIPMDRLHAIRALSEHFLVAGDPDQRIYKVDFSETRMLDLLSPRVSMLTEIFRLTQTLLDVAVSIYPPAANATVGVDVVGGKDSSARIVSCATPAIESAWVWQQALERASAGSPSVILLPSHRAIGDYAREVARLLELPDPAGAQSASGGKDYVRFNEFWETHGVPLMYLGNGLGSLPTSDSKPLVYLMTLHSVKGLDFDNVFLPGMNDNAFIWGKADSEEDAEMARRLLFVAVTRSRSNLFISFSGRTLHDAVSRIPPHLTIPLRIDEVNDEPDDSADFEDWI